MAYANATSNTHAPFGLVSLGQVFKAISRGITQMQVGRMNSVLQSMTDVQLDQIGVKRSEIAQHAEALIIDTSASK